MKSRVYNDGFEALGLAVAVQALQDYELLTNRKADDSIVYGATYSKKELIKFIESEVFWFWSGGLIGRECMKIIDRKVSR